MAWSPISLSVPQYVDSNGTPYSGAVLKAYTAGTTTPISLATDSTGGTTAGSIALNASGYPAVSGNVVIPHVSANYKLTLYPTQAAADANSGALWSIDNLSPIGASGGSSLVGFLQSGTGAVARTMQAKGRDEVNTADFGAATTASAATNAAAFQAALDTGRTVKTNNGIYEYDTQLVMKAIGQRFIGEGMGDNDVSGLTVFKYTGAAGGGLFTFNNSGTHMQNGAIEECLFNGNALANNGITLYDNAVAGGAWRQRLKNVGIYGVTYEAVVAAGSLVAGTTYTIKTTGTSDFTTVGAVWNTVGVPFKATDVGTGTGTCYQTAIAIRAGTGTGADNSNEFVLDHVYTQGSPISIQSGGAMGSLVNRCNIKQSSVAGVWAMGGCAIDIGNTTFALNGWDVISGSRVSGTLTGSQKVVGMGGWAENSTNGFYQAHTSHGLALEGYFLHTDNASHLMEMFTPSGQWTAKGCTVGSSSASTLITGMNTTYAFDTGGSNFTFDAAYNFNARIARMRATTIRADQHAFGAYFTADVASVATGDGSTYNITGATWTEFYDVSTAFTNGTYTAPDDGHYQFNATATIIVGASHTAAGLYLVTTGKTYLLDNINAAAARNATNNTITLKGSVAAGMTATDTAYLALIVQNGAATSVTVCGDNSGAWTRFDGHLL